MCIKAQPSRLLRMTNAAPQHSLKSGHTHFREKNAVFRCQYWAGLKFPQISMHSSETSKFPKSQDISQQL